MNTISEKLSDDVKTARAKDRKNDTVQNSPRG